jgi:3-oxoacyl-[acyl-carrier protein] reductase
MFKDYRVALTGATSGIGLATAKRFIDDGATVIGIGRDFKQTVSMGDNFIPCKCDVSIPAEIDMACAFIDETFGGKLDIFVNAAGAGTPATLTSITAEDFDAGMHLLVLAPILFGKNLYPLLLKSPQNYPSIINIASVASRRVLPDDMLYNLAKNACVLYTKQQTLGFIGVRCNSISPGFTDTPMLNREGSDLSPEQIQETFDSISAVIPCGRIAQAEEVADTVAFLASTDASYINGADLLMDGGFTTTLK